MKVKLGLPDDWEPKAEEGASSIRAELARLAPLEYEAVTSRWTIERLFVYLSIRGFHATLDELRRAMDDFRKMINGRISSPKR